MKSVFALFISIFCSIIAVAQLQTGFITEEYLLALNNYNQYKENLPRYFFPYTLGGTNNDDSNIDEAILRARAYVVPVPVLITGEKYDNSYNIWVNNFKALGYSSENADGATLTYREKLALEPIKSDKDSASLAKEIITKELQLAEAKKKEAQNQKEQPKPKEDKKKATNNAKAETAPLSPFTLLPDTIKAIVKEKGDKYGYIWLYNQQIIAGNVLFVDPITLIPVAVNIEGDEAINNYNITLNAWKKAYPSIWAKSTNEQHNLIEKDIDAYFGQFGKASNVNANFMQHMETYQAILKTITTQ
jgi:hypothetical protein